MKLDGWLAALICVLLATVGVSLPASAQAGNDAQVVGSTIPATMIPAFSYSASVTMKNTGTTTWTKAEGYSLGGVGDSDPFAPARIALGDGDSIAPGQDKTFSFTMVAPSAGVYTTDWRMLRESVEWFGDTLTKQVNVTFGPTPPGAPTIIWPTQGMVLGSNRPDIRFQGDPSDGYEVHVGPCNRPDSGDGWDSGFVSANPSRDPISAICGVLNPQTYHYVFVRQHNPNGWGPWTAAGHWVYIAGQLINEPYVVSGSGLEWWSDAAYNPTRNEYCMTWQNGYVIKWRRLDSAGAVLGSEHALSDGVTQGHHYSTICYNSARQEYLILYSGWIGGVGDHMRVLRVDATTGNQIGGTIWLDTIGTNSTTGGLDLAYSSTSNSYLAAYECYNEGNVYGRILDAYGNPTGSRIQIDTPSQQYSRNPVVAWNSVNNEYLVTYMGLGSGSSWDYWAQRIRVSDGALLGSNLQLASTGDVYNYGGAAYDPSANRYLVVWDGGSSPPWGQFVSNTASLVGSKFALGAGLSTGWAASVCYDSSKHEFLVSWSGSQTGTNYSRRVSQGGVCIGNAFSNTGAWESVGNGNWPPRPVYNSVNDEFLIHWHNSYATILDRRYKSSPVPPPDTQPPAPVTNLNVTRTPTGMSLSWTNPSSADFSGTMVRSKVGSPPSGPADGKLVVDKPNCPGVTDTFVDTVEPRGTLVCYAAFAYDLTGNYADAATACGMLVAGDFDGDNDVDQKDFGHLQACFSGSGQAYDSACQDADVDLDGAVDQNDFDIFRACMGGANQAPGC